MRFSRLIAFHLALVSSTATLAAPAVVQAPVARPATDANWFYAGSDIKPDPSWTFGTLPNGLRYAIRRNPLPDRLISIRVRMDVGALNEQDHEQGWAHFVEHMAFRGTRSFADGEARETWQKLGASFGSDTNATTNATQTIYQLDLPHADRESLDKSLDVLAEMMDSARFDPAIVEAERKVVLAEKGRRPELGVRMDELSRPLFFAGLKMADRNTIGTNETLGAATSEGLRTFYERWYRPERATVVMVGDADPKMMEELLLARFGGWTGSGPAPAEPDYGAIAAPEDRTAVFTYPTAPHVAQVMWVRPWQRRPDTVAEERDDLKRMLAARIINRRLEARARGGAAPFTGAGLGTADLRNVADVTQLQVTAREGKWREGLNEAFAILADALATPPSQAEIDRETQNLRTAALAAVDGEDTVRSQQRAAQVLNAVEAGDVIATATDTLDLIDRLSADMSPALIFDGMKGLFQGEDPRMLVMSPTAIEGGAAAAAQALAAAEKAEPAVREADRTVTMADLPALGAPGREVSRERIADLDTTIVRFANGSTLTFKQTDFEKGSVAVQVRLGSGIAGLAADRQPLTWLAGLVMPSGMANLDVDGLERVMTGRRLGLNFNVAEDSYMLQGATNKADLADQLRLMATKIAYPRWDEPMFERVKSSMLDNYDLSFASASSRAGRELNAFVRGNDKRWLPIERETIAATTFEQFQDFFAPQLADGPVDVTIVGDTDLESAVAAVKGTIAALPVSKAAADPTPAKDEQVRPPLPAPDPVTFTHQGDADQAFAAIGWTTFGGLEKRRDRRALALAANMMQVRLFEQLRQVEGASYSPSALSASSDIFADWGIFYASSELKPDSVPTFYRIARSIIADLAAKPVSAAEFERALNPVVSGIERRVRTNAYWVGAMADWARRPETIETARTYMNDFRTMTAQEVQQAVAAYVADQGDWSMLVLPAKDPHGADRSDR